MKTFSNNTQAHKHPQHAGGGGIISLNAPTESIHSHTTPTCHTESHTDLTPCHTDLALSHTDSLSCHTDLERSEREVSSSQIQNTFSTTSAKRKKVYPLSAPLNPKKNKATAFSFLQSRGKPRYSASSIKSAGDTTAPFESDFMHHEAGESRNERKACNIDSMDCHATAAAVSSNDSISNAYINTTHNDSKATATPSTAKKLTLSVSLALAAALELAANSSGCNNSTHLSQNLNGTQYCQDLSSYNYSVWITLDNSDRTMDTTLPSSTSVDLDYRLTNNHNVGDVTHDTNNNRGSEWVGLYDSGSNMKGEEAHIKSFTLKNSTKFEIKLTGPTTINTLNNQAKRVNLRTNGSNSTLTINTLNQDNGNISNGGSNGSSTNSGDTQIFKGATVNNFNLQSGKAYQFDGTVGNLTITGGEYYQGINDANNAVPDSSTSNQNFGTGGTIKNLILAGGTFKYYKGQVENITLVAQTTQASVSSTQSSEGSQGSDSSTPPSLFGKGSPSNANGTGPTNAYNGLIQSVTQQGGKNTATLSNGTTIEATLTNSDPNNRTKGLTINNETGDLTNSGNLTELNITQSPNGQTAQAYSTQESKSITNTAGAKITTLTLFDGYTTINNYGTITTITHNQSGAAQSRSAAQTLAVLTIPTVIYNGEKGYISSYNAEDNAQIINNGKIGTLTLKQDNNNITNNPKYDENGKLINGIIDKLVMSGGNNSINTLDGVAYNANTGMSTLDLQGGTLAVDTLSVGLNGNVAKHRIDLSSSSANKNGTLSVKNIEVAYVDGNFNPTKHINTDLKDYVNNGTTVTNQLDTKSPITFRSSE
ncbi:hypothetical protein, partial [Helicobacter cinaedi]|uniref:hypothetical protein n=1 Tax=Helicobacter cinaedi TaxID=213 RepID=UPI00131551EF